MSGVLEYRAPMCIPSYRVATISRLLKIIGLFCKRALQQRFYFAKETSCFKEPTKRSHPVLDCWNTRTVRCGVLRCVEVCHARENGSLFTVRVACSYDEYSVVQSGAVGCSMLLCVAMCCSVSCQRKWVSVHISCCM